MSNNAHQKLPSITIQNKLQPPTAPSHHFNISCLPSTRLDPACPALTIRLTEQSQGRDTKVTTAQRDPPYNYQQRVAASQPIKNETSSSHTQPLAKAISFIIAPFSQALASICLMFSIVKHLMGELCGSLRVPSDSWNNLCPLMGKLDHSRVVHQALLAQVIVFHCLCLQHCSLPKQAEAIRVRQQT